MLLLPTPHLLYSTVGPQTRFAASERCSSQSALTRLCGRTSIGGGGFTLIRPFLQDTGIANPRQYRHYMPAPNALFISRRFLTLLPHSFVYLSITLTLEILSYLICFPLTSSLAPSNWIDFELQWRLQWLECLVSSYLQ